MLKKKHEKNYWKYIVVLTIIILNVFLVSIVLKNNLNGKFDPSTITDTTYDTDGELTAHTRYISEETIGSLNKNSKWKTDEKLKKELEDTMKTNPDDVQEYIVEK